MKVEKVIISGEMPESCKECDLRDYVAFEHTGSGFSVCSVIKYDKGIFAIIENLGERLSECPLVTKQQYDDELFAELNKSIGIRQHESEDNRNEKILVRELGERIGYGNLMQLASECWQESLKAKGLPSGGAFSVGLPYDLLIKKESEDE